MKSCCGTVKERKKKKAFFIKHVIFTFTVRFCEKTSGRESSSEGSEAMLRLNRMTAIFFSCEIALQDVLSMRPVCTTASAS